MRYLTLDGMMSGTGVRDSAEGGYVELDKIGISEDLKTDIIAWHANYQAEHYRGYSDTRIVQDLDRLGVSLAIRLSNELSESKVEYFSDALMQKIQFKKQF